MLNYQRLCCCFFNQRWHVSFCWINQKLGLCFWIFSVDSSSRTWSLEWCFLLPWESRVVCLFGWWFGTCLFSHILGIVIPIDFHIFQRDGSTTNQHCIWMDHQRSFDGLLCSTQLDFRSFSIKMRVKCRMVKLWSSSGQALVERIIQSLCIQHRGPFCCNEFILFDGFV